MYWALPPGQIERDQIPERRGVRTVRSGTYRFLSCRNWPQRSAACSTRSISLPLQGLPAQRKPGLGETRAPSKLIACLEPPKGSPQLSFKPLHPILECLLVVLDGFGRADQAEKVGPVRAVEDDAQHAMIGPQLLLGGRVERAFFELIGALDI